jgi:hypothetical protein
VGIATRIPTVAVVFLEQEAGLVLLDLLVGSELHGATID